MVSKRGRGAAAVEQKGGGGVWGGGGGKKKGQRTLASRTIDRAGCSEDLCSSSVESSNTAFVGVRAGHGA